MASFNSAGFTRAEFFLPSGQHSFPIFVRNALEKSSLTLYFYSTF